MLTSIPTQTPVTGHVLSRSYNVARPVSVQTDSDADAFVAGLLASREDAELLSAPVLGRDRMGRPVVVVTVKPAGAKLLESPVPVFTLVPTAQSEARQAYEARYPHLATIRDWRTFAANASRLSCEGIALRHVMTVTTQA